MQNSFRQFLTRFATSDWFLAMLKIGSVVPVGSCVSETVNNIENIKWKVVLFIIVTDLLLFPGRVQKSMKHYFEILGNQ